MRPKVLYLSFNDLNNNNIILDKITSEYKYDAFCVLKPINKFFRMLRRIHICLGIPGIEMWFNDWKYDVSDYTLVICIASIYSKQVLKWIKKQNSGCRCINYYWDSIEVSKYPIVHDSNIENWSFYEKDCVRYHMRYNPQFYMNTINLPKSVIIYDISYVGADRGGLLKDRNLLVKKYYELFKSMGINAFFYYVTKSEIVDETIRQDKQMPEEEFYSICSKGRAILDIVENDINWMTLRPLLAISNNKKVVTNNKSIMNEKFYSKDNIFILGIDKDSDLLDFLRSDFVPVERQLLEYYEFESWIHRFLQDESAS